MAASEEIVDLGSLLDAGESAIVTLVAGETRLAAYRAVLAARSPVFEAMFRHDTLESRSGQVTIADVEGPVLRQLLVYLYTLRVPQVPGMATQLLLAADKYGLPGLKAECELQLADQLTVENAVDTAVLATRHSCPSLTEAAVSFIKGHSYEVMATRAWADAVLNRPAVLVELRQLLAQPSTETRNLPREEKGRRLIETAKQGSVVQLRTLLSAGAEIGAMEGDMMTALHWAAERGHVGAVRCLVEHKADVNARNRWRSTPLHFAAQNGHVAVVQVLLKASANHSARGSQGRTPLHYAAEFSCTDAVAALLNRGANKAARDDTGKSPLDRAKESQQRLTELLT